VTTGSDAELMPTHDITLCHYTIDRSITPESFIELSLLVLEIIRGQNKFLEKANR
jgi:hypothetical protein